MATHYGRLVVFKGLCSCQSSSEKNRSLVTGKNKNFRFLLRWRRKGSFKYRKTLDTTNSSNLSYHIYTIKRRTRRQN